MFSVRLLRLNSASLGPLAQLAEQRTFNRLRPFLLMTVRTASSGSGASIDASVRSGLGLDDAVRDTQVISAAPAIGSLGALMQRPRPARQLVAESQLAAVGMPGHG